MRPHIAQEPNVMHVSIPYLDLPALSNADAVAQFDRTVLASNPSLGAFMRRCSRAEYPAGHFDRMCPPSNQLLKLVLRTRSGGGLALLYVRPLADRPEDLCASLEKESAMQGMIRELTGAKYENN